jgi:hypothetical protein
MITGLWKIEVGESMPLAIEMMDVATANQGNDTT